MPHSSGGGHSGGGHSGGGHGGHRGLGGFSSRGSSTIRPHYYVCHIHGKRYERRLSESPVVTRIAYIIMTVIFALAFIAGLSVTLENSVFPVKMKSGYTEAIIEDEANMLGNTAELKNTLDVFGEKTGITIAIVTVYNDEYDSSLEDYAYNRYLSTFDDEDSWLFVVSCSRSNPSDSTLWAWEGMQGDNTDCILTSNVLWSFNLMIQNNLYCCERGGVGALFSEALSGLCDRVMTVSLDKTAFVLTSSFGFTVILLIILTVRSYIIYGKKPQISHR